MGNYTGAKCISCGEIFKDGDDVVVCPECGTPYHRDCYFKEGKCINEQLHEAGQSWKQEEAPTEEESGSIRCIRCGYENTPEKLFCEKCGTPLMKNMSEERPFNTADGRSSGGNGENFSQNGGFGNYGANDQAGAQPQFVKQVFDQNSEIDGVKLGDYAKYVGGNPVTFLTNFIRFGKFGGKVSINFFAFIFPEIYFLYRKVKPWGVIIMLLMAVLSIPAMVYCLGSGMYGVKLDVGISLKSQNFLVLYEVTSYVSLAIKVIMGLFANYIYYKQAKKDITRIREEMSDSEEETVQKISAKGGVSWISVILGFTVYSVISIGAVMVMGKMT